jgi:hypothetical protein
VLLQGAESWQEIHIEWAVSGRLSQLCRSVEQHGFVECTSHWNEVISCPARQTLDIGGWLSVAFHDDPFEHVFARLTQEL